MNLSLCPNKFPFLCVFCVLTRSITHLPLWLQMTSYFTRRECKSPGTHSLSLLVITAQILIHPMRCHFKIKTLWHEVIQKSMQKCVLLYPHPALLCLITYYSLCVYTVIASSTRWTLLARYVRSWAKDRWPTWTKASSTPWHSTSSVPTNASVTPSAKSGWADQFILLSSSLVCLWYVFSYL